MNLEITTTSTASRSPRFCVYLREPLTYQLCRDPPVSALFVPAMLLGKQSMPQASAQILPPLCSTLQASQQNNSYRVLSDHPTAPRTTVFLSGEIYWIPCSVSRLLICRIDDVNSTRTLQRVIALFSEHPGMTSNVLCGPISFGPLLDCAFRSISWLVIVISLENRLQYRRKCNPEKSVGYQRIHEDHT